MKLWWQLGFDIDGKELNDVFARFKTVAASKKVNYINSVFSCMHAPTIINTIIN